MTMIDVLRELTNCNITVHDGRDAYALSVDEWEQFCKEKINIDWIRIHCPKR